MDEQLEEEQPPAKKPRIDNPELGEIIANSNESDLPTSKEPKDEVPENSSMDLLDCHHSRPLPLELNCEIFKCLDLLIQRKFIWGLGREIYEMFAQKLHIKLIKSKRLRNPAGNRVRNGVNFLISDNGLNVSLSVRAINRNPVRAQYVSTEKGFPISGKYSRLDNFPGTILYYYEVSVLSFLGGVRIGLSSGNIPNGTLIGVCPNSYAISFCFNTACYLTGELHRFQLPEGAIRPEIKENRNVYGCGLVLDPENNLTIFFTVNGKLLGKQIPINPSVAILFPTVSIWRYYVEANFGDDPEKPFEFDTKNFPGLGLECI